MRTRNARFHALIDLILFDLHSFDCFGFLKLLKALFSRSSLLQHLVRSVVSVKKYPSPLSYINGKSPVQGRDGWVLALSLFLHFMGLDVSVYDDAKKNTSLKFSHYYLTLSQVGSQCS